MCDSSSLYLLYNSTYHIKQSICECVCSAASLCLPSASSQCGGEALNCLEKEAIGIEVEGWEASGCKQKTVCQGGKGSSSDGDVGLPSKAKTKETTSSRAQQQGFR